MPLSIDTLARDHLCVYGDFTGDLLVDGNDIEFLKSQLHGGVNDGRCLISTLRATKSLQRSTSTIAVPEPAIAGLCRGLCRVGHAILSGCGGWSMICPGKRADFAIFPIPPYRPLFLRRTCTNGSVARKWSCLAGSRPRCVRVIRTDLCIFVVLAGLL